MAEPSSATSAPLQPAAGRERHFNQSLDLLCIAGLDGYFKEVNPSWTRVLGWTREELLARPVEDFMHPEDRARTLQARANLAKGVPLRELENRYLCKDGSYRWLSWQSSIDPAGSTVFAVARDITERRQVENEHLILSKLKSTGVLAGGIAHDFNNLLTGIMLNLEMLRLTGDMNPEQKKHIQQALDTANAAHAVTQQLLTFSSGGDSARKTLDLRVLLQQSLDLGLSGSNSRGDSQFPTDLWPAEVDEDQITQVIRNLVLNAREAMPSGGMVILRAENLTVEPSHRLDLAPGNYLRISVKDEGPGIPAEILPKIFDPYFSTKQRGIQKGMGLGLTICHSVIQKHGGTIKIDSVAGRGTTVLCYLPASELPLVVPTLSPDSFSSAASHKILVMDDEESIRNVLAQTLIRLGYTVESAKDGREALSLYENASAQGSPFDAVLLDLTVKGGMGGAETIKILRERSPEVQAVLLTGYNQEQTFREYSAHGFRAAISKPFQIQKLRHVLSSVLAGQSNLS
jgi:PAS domain S-box-containing protein